MITSRLLLIKKKLGSNNDAKISLKEAVKDKSLAAQFDGVDANHDGMISIEEYANYKTSIGLPTPSAPTAN